MQNPSSTFASLLAATVLATLAAGCSDLTQPGEIKIIAEPPTPAQQIAPKADVAPKPGALQVDGANPGEKALRRPAGPVEKKAPGASCGG